MDKLLKIISLLLVLFMLTSCSVNVSKDNNIPPSVTIETYRTNSTTQTQSTTTDEPEVTTTPDSKTDATDSTPITTDPTASNEASTTTESTTESTTVPTTEPTVSNEEPTITNEEYTITDFDTVMYATDNLNVREEPDADSDRVGRYKKGEAVTVTGFVSNGWVRVNYEDKVCFVNGKYLINDKSNDITSDTTVTTEEQEIVEDELENVVVGNNKYTALNYSEQKAIWFAYLDIDPMLKDATESEFRQDIADAFNIVSATGFNTVYVHVRAFGDAYYYSDYYEFTDGYSGRVGRRPAYDPLEVMIEEAHKLGLSFHAWVNPMRTAREEQFKQMDDSFTLKKWYNSSSANGTYLVYNSKTEFYWLSPAYPAVRELICNGVAEIVTNYNVDAIHIDDYFYPTTSAQFDEAAYKASGTTKTLSDWRRSMVSILVKEMYQTVKSCNKTVEFGISPAGNTKNNYESYYADIYTWGSETGYCDYMVPQIYYGFEDALPFDDTVVEWHGIVTNPSVKLVCGIAAYKVGSNTEWSSGNMIRRQVDVVNSATNYDGYALYRYDTIFNADSDTKTLMSTELMNLFR